MAPTMNGLSPTVLEGLSEQTQVCVQRLRDYKIEEPDLSNQPSGKLAAVLVLLFERAGRLRVLLTTRSKLLRSHPGQTALPGGKVDETDNNFIQTAYREAHEEVALPQDSPHIHTLCLLEPFLSVSGLLVTPVVSILSDPSLLGGLKASVSEVAEIFEHPLEAILDPALSAGEPLVPKGSEHWMYEVELHSTTDVQLPSLGNTVYRMHRFRSAASPIKGLTSDILIKTAEIAYGKPTTYERYASQQLHGFPAIVKLLETVGQVDSYTSSMVLPVQSTPAVPAP